MSASPSSPAPAWLTVPADADDLVPGIWPASAGRDAHGALEVGGVSAAELVRRFGTPLYVMDEAEARSRARRIRVAFEAAAAAAGTTARLYYAGKAFLCTEMVRWMRGEGLGVDVCTSGELAVALAASADPAALGLHGNNKSADLLARAVAVGVGAVVIDSDDEIDRLAAVTSGLTPPQPVLLRVRTGVHADTHSYLATAHEDQKFGFAPDQVARAAARVRALPGLRLEGLHCHIGSQILDPAGFEASAQRLVALHADLLADGPLPVMNLGGGFGIAYTRADSPPPIEAVAERIVGAVADACAARDIPVPGLAFEPGRWIAGPSGLTLYAVGTVKPITVGPDATRTYVSVDGGMSDNPRPALYGAAYSARIASRRSGAQPVLTRVVGSHCESGDILVDAEYLPGDVSPGDVLAVPATGAYCFSLSGNYNYVPRPPVVSVTGGRARVLVRGETVDDLLRRDTGIGNRQEGEE